MLHKKRAYVVKQGGPLLLTTIQRVYEDNIKSFGTLTCYLCFKNIEFGSDSLDHKTPLSRGGTNKYENLAVAHFRCNCRKNNKTEKEYREWLNK
jgi:5-methylcytosine-specific restriction endonuclease McrA